jgi:hypothetical protein
MKREAVNPIIIAVSCLLTQCPAALCEALLASQSDREVILRGAENGSPSSNNSTQPLSGNDVKPEPIPGSDAVMTPELLLVSPASKEGAHPPLPLSAFVGQNLILKLERSDITLNGLQGVQISVVNDTSRPLVLDGDSARATVSGRSYPCTSLVALQKCVLPKHDAKDMAEGVFTKVIPTAVTVGAVPTVEDFNTIRKPIPLRYGPDERRRLAEASRFGRRILWPHQKTEGIVYFPGNDSLTGAAIELPVHTLFDKPDATSLSGTK